MKKLSKILVLLILAALLFSCGGSGGGSGLSNLFNNNSSHNYSFKNRNFSNDHSGDALEMFVFGDGTVTHTIGAGTANGGTHEPIVHSGTYTESGNKTGTLTITYNDGTAQFSKAYTYGETGHDFTFNEAPTITFNMH